MVEAIDTQFEQNKQELAGALEHPYVPIFVGDLLRPIVLGVKLVKTKVIERFIRETYSIPDYQKGEEEIQQEIQGTMGLCYKGLLTVHRPLIAVNRDFMEGVSKPERDYYFKMILAKESGHGLLIDRTDPEYRKWLTLNNPILGTEERLNSDLVWAVNNAVKIHYRLHKGEEEREGEFGFSPRSWLEHPELRSDYIYGLAASTATDFLHVASELKMMGMTDHQVGKIARKVFIERPEDVLKKAKSLQNNHPQLSVTKIGSAMLRWRNPEKHLTPKQVVAEPAPSDGIWSNFTPKEHQQLMDGFNILSGDIKNSATILPIPIQTQNGHGSKQEEIDPVTVRRWWLRKKWLVPPGKSGISLDEFDIAYKLGGQGEYTDMILTQYQKSIGSQPPKQVYPIRPSVISKTSQGEVPVQWDFSRTRPSKKVTPIISQPSQLSAISGGAGDFVPEEKNYVGESLPQRPFFIPPDAATASKRYYQSRPTGEREFIFINQQV